LSQNEDLIPSMKFGIFFEMLGNDNDHALQLSRQGNTLIDMAARNVMKNSLSKFNEGQFREIVSNDEMVFNGPGVDIPMISISRWPYPEYHTSDDNMSIIKSEKLEESRDIILKIIDSLEKNYTPKRMFKGPPFLSKYGLWIDWRVNPKLNLMIEKLFLELEGDKSIIEIAEFLDLNFEDVYNYINKFVDADLVEILNKNL
jgi:aminopeptidase-like protein